MTSEGNRIVRKLLKNTVSALWWCVLALLFALIVNIIGAKMAGRVPSVCGYSVMHIVSGSMEEKIPAGSYILIKKVSPDKVKINDIICFYSDDPAIYGLPNTHRVVEEPIRVGEGFEFVTRGDANPGKDHVTAKGERLIGVYVDTLDGLTAISSVMSGNTLVIIFIVLQLSVMGMALYIIVSVKKSKDKNSEPPVDK